MKARPRQGVEKHVPSRQSMGLSYFQKINCIYSVIGGRTVINPTVPSEIIIFDTDIFVR